MDHGEQGVALPAEIGVDAEDKADEQTVEAVTAQVVRCHEYHRRVFGEEGRERFGQELRI